MKKNVIDIIERFQTHHALQEERELKNSHVSRNGAVAPSAPDKTGMPEHSDKNMDVNRSRPNESTRDVDLPTPHVERVVRTIRVRASATAMAPTPRMDSGTEQPEGSSFQIAAFFINHPILVMLALWLITLIVFLYIFAMPIR